MCKQYNVNYKLYLRVLYITHFCWTGLSLLINLSYNTFIWFLLGHMQNVTMMRPDSAHVEALLKDTVTTLCKNGLPYSTQLHVQGLLGITLDASHVYLVQIDERFGGQELQSCHQAEAKPSMSHNILRDSKFLLDNQKVSYTSVPLQNTPTEYYLQNSARLERESSIETEASTVETEASTVETEASTVDSQYGESVNEGQDISSNVEQHVSDVLKRRNSQSDTSSVSSQSRRRKRRRPVYRGPLMESRTTMISDENVESGKVSIHHNNEEASSLCYKSLPSVNDKMYSVNDMEGMKESYSRFTHAPNSHKDSEGFYDDLNEQQSAYMTALLAKNRHIHNLPSNSHWEPSHHTPTPNDALNVSVNDTVDGNLVPCSIDEMLIHENSAQSTSELENRTDNLVNINTTLEDNEDMPLNHSGNCKSAADGVQVNHLPVDSDMNANILSAGENSETVSLSTNANSDILHTEGSITSDLLNDENSKHVPVEGGSNIWSPAVMHHSSSSNSVAAAAEVLSQLVSV